MPDGSALAVHALPPGTLDDKSLGRKVRRADRLSKMTVFAAADALLDAAIPSDINRGRIGLIVASAFATHATTFQFLDDILTYGDGEVSPTVFSHSVQNAPAAYIATSLELPGPVLTLTQVHFAFHHALILAEAWLAGGRCDYVLVGAMDELGAVMHTICHSILPKAQDDRITPFAFAPNPGTVPGEGSAFLVVSHASAARYGSVRRVDIARRLEPWSAPDVHLLEADGMLPDETGYSAFAQSGASLAAYAPLFGGMTGGSALHCTIAALMLKEQTVFASPVLDFAGALPVIREAGAAAVESVHLTRLDCTGRAGRIALRRYGGCH